MSMRLAEALLSSGLAEESIRDRVRGIHQDLLGHSRYVREPNFVSIHPDDLEFLFQAYDQRSFGGLFTFLASSVDSCHRCMTSCFIQKLAS